MDAVDSMVVLLGYLLGAVPSAYLIGRLNGVDLAREGDGALGASLSFRRLGLVSGFAVGLMDFGKGIVAVVSAQAFGVPREIVMLAGFAAVVGHDWSLFLGFKGGRGSLAAYGVMAALGAWQFIAAALAALAVFYFVRKSTLVTVILFAVLTIMLHIQGVLRIPQAPVWEQAWLAVFPMTLLLPGFVKYLQVRGTRRLCGVSRKGTPPPP